MSKSALALAAAVLAATTLSNAANAGGIRLGFGFPLGSFVAKPFQDSSRDVSRSYQKKQAKPAYAARRQPKASAPKVRVANTPEPRKISKPAHAKVETKVATAATPVATETTPEVKKVTIEKPVETAALPPKTTVKADEKPAETVKVSEVENTKKSDDDNAQVCRKFSPVVGGLVEIPCE